MCWYIAEFLFATETMLMLCMTLKRLWIALQFDPTWGTILWSPFFWITIFVQKQMERLEKRVYWFLYEMQVLCLWIHLHTLFKLWLLFRHKNSNEKQQLMTRCSRLALRDNLTFCSIQGCILCDNRCSCSLVVSNQLWGGFDICTR